MCILSSDLLCDHLYHSSLLQYHLHSILQFAYMLVKDCIYGALVCRTCILQAKGYHSVAVHSPWHSEGCMLLVFWIHFDLIISGEAIHEGYPLEFACIVCHDIRDREREHVFGTSGVQITKVDADSDLFVLLGDRNDVGYPIRVLPFLTKLKSMSFLTSNSIAFMISGQNCHCYCLTGFAFELILRRCIGTKGSCPGISSKFQAKTSIYSCIRCTTSSFSEGSKLLLMKIGLGLDLLPKLIWVTLSSVDG